MRSVLLILLLFCVLSPLMAQSGVGPCPVGRLPEPLRGVVTIVTPNGQFYLNAGGKQQLYSGAKLVISRDGSFLAYAMVIKIDRLDAIAQLEPGFIGMRLRAGDQFTVQMNPIPAMAFQGLPDIEPDVSQRENELLFSLLLLYGVAAALID